MRCGPPSRVLANLPGGTRAWKTGCMLYAWWTRIAFKLSPVDHEMLIMYVVLLDVLVGSIVRAVLNGDSRQGNLLSI